MRRRKNDQVGDPRGPHNGRMTNWAGSVGSVNVVDETLKAPARYTAIDKRPVQGREEVSELDLVTDTQCDTRIHGGVDKPVSAYAAEDAAWWSRQLDREVPPRPVR